MGLILVILRYDMYKQYHVDHNDSGLHQSLAHRRAQIYDEILSRGIWTHWVIRKCRPPRIGTARKRNLGITPILRPVLLDGEIRIVGKGPAILVGDLIGVAIPHQRIVPAIRLRAHDVPVPDGGLEAPRDGVVEVVVGGAAANGRGGGTGRLGDGEGRVEADTEG